MTDKKLSGKEFEALCKAGVSLDTIHLMHGKLQMCTKCDEEVYSRMLSQVNAQNTATNKKL